MKCPLCYNGKTPKQVIEISSYRRYVKQFAAD